MNIKDTSRSDKAQMILYFDLLKDQLQEEDQLKMIQLFGVVHW